LYQALGRPRRVFSCLIQLARHRNAQRHDAAAQAALDEARALINPDWPVEFRIFLLRIGGYLALETGRLDEALTFVRDVVRVSAAAGDWRLEVMARSNLVNVLWTAGPIEEAAREACKLAEELRARPAADSDMATLYANLIGVLSEAGHIDDASAAASDSLPIMRRAHALYLEEWVYLFWRRGQIDTAALLLGALDAQQLRTAVPLQVNERRLIAEARPAIEGEQRPEALSAGLAAGAALGEAELFGLISEALAQPMGPR
jgi:tetratricopeptide (TPR) repeat protein